jgi:serine/threonine protein kinase
MAATARRATRRPLTQATTRTRQADDPFAQVARLVAPGHVVRSAESGLEYRVERFLGAGGFGQAYLARRLRRSSTVPETVCLKLSTRQDGWLREAYFGHLLAEQPRAIRVFDAFPWPSRDGAMLYGLALEYAAHGDLGGCLARASEPWPEASIRREIAGILQVLGRLHRGQLLHRDLTPMNVFVCDGHRLKLGDFGIVRQLTDTRGITARTMNAMTAPSDILAGTVPKWQARDDVYQVGQLIGMLVLGSASARIRPKDVRTMTCSDHLKEVIYRCLGERRKRFESADELIAALRARPAGLASARRRSLKGVHLAFTGILTLPRKDAIAAATRAGAIVHGGPSALTSVVVRGRPNPLQAAGRDGGIKLMDVKRLRDKGHKIAVLTEAQFWRLAGKRP